MKNPEKKINTQKLTAYSALAGVFILSGLDARSQIVYTDLEPDVTIGIGDSYELDLDDDGNTDFNFILNSFILTSLFYTTGTAGAIYDGIINRMLIYPSGGNSVNASTLSGTAGSTFAYPYALNNGDIVNDDLNFKDNSYQFMGLYLSVLDFPASGSVYAFGNYGNWPNKNNKFIGVKFDIDGDSHFGWVRMSMDELELTIDDFAYEASTDTEIETGVTVAIDNVIPADKINAYSFGNTVTVLINNLQAQNATIRIMNALGENVFSDNLNLAGMNIQLATAMPAMYMLHITADGAVYNKELFIH